MSVRAGVLYGVAACLLWGVLPLYFRLVDEAGPIEVIAHRAIWSLVVLVGLLVAVGRLGSLARVVRDGRSLRLLAASAVVIGLNWGLYVYAVFTDRVIEAALGYFVTPLVSVALGIVVFGERLRRAQTAALGLGAVAVVVLAVYYGSFPWIALCLSVTFGSYSMLRKLADVGTAEGLTVETLVLLVPALAYLGALAWTGDGAFADGDLGLTLLLAAAGPVTAVPLLLFGACVTRVPLTTVGLLQYLVPVLQFLVGWALLGEHMTVARWTGFALVWLALSLLASDALRATRPRPLPA